MDKVRIKKGMLPYLEQFRHLRTYLIQAGIKLEPLQVYIILYSLTAVIDLSLLFYILYLTLQNEIGLIYLLVISLVMITLGYALIFLLIWLIFTLMLDYLKFKRKTEVEEVLPEFLRLVSANHRSGLPLDISLWKANRDRFGVLSEEINHIARSTYASGSLIKPLEEFSKKYDSNLLKRVISNLIEGIKTGSEMAPLLDNIALDMVKIRYLRKDLATEVEHYMLFITITVLVISPFMFGMAHKMSGLIESVKGILADTMDESVVGVTRVPVMLEISATQEKKFSYYFDLFVYLMLATNSIISVLLTSTVKYGNVKQELKKIPVIYVISILIYVISKSLLSGFLIS